MNMTGLKLAVADWRPYQHQARALEQLVGRPIFERVPIVAIASSARDASVGPFLALVGEAYPIPLLGLPTIVEALHRLHPELCLLPADPLARARSRALSQIIEQRFTYVTLAGIAAHDAHGGPVWAAGSDVGARILETPPPLDSVEKHHAGRDTRFLAGDQPSLADCQLAALWWSTQDLSLDESLAALPALSRWHAQNCSGSPFSRRDEPSSRKAQ